MRAGSNDALPGLCYSRAVFVGVGTHQRNTRVRNVSQLFCIAQLFVLEAQVQACTATIGTGVQ